MPELLTGRKFGAQLYHKELVQYLAVENKTPTNLPEELRDNLPSEYIWHLKHTLKSSMTELDLFESWKAKNTQYILKERLVKGITKALIFVDCENQLPILKKFPFTIEFDTTFDTVSINGSDSDMFLQGNFTLQDCCNNSYIICTVIYMSNEKSKIDFLWIFNSFQELLNKYDIPFPLSFGVDR